MNSKTAVVKLLAAFVLIVSFVGVHGTPVDTTQTNKLAVKVSPTDNALLTLRKFCSKTSESCHGRGEEPPNGIKNICEDCVNICAQLDDSTLQSLGQVCQGILDDMEPVETDDVLV